MKGINLKGLLQSNNNLKIQDLLNICEIYDSIPENKNLHYDPEIELIIEVEKTSRELLKELEIDIF